MYKFHLCHYSGIVDRFRIRLGVAVGTFRLFPMEVENFRLIHQQVAADQMFRPAEAVENPHCFPHEEIVENLRVGHFDILRIRADENLPDCLQNHLAKMDPYYLIRVSMEAVLVDCHQEAQKFLTCLLMVQYLGMNLAACVVMNLRLDFYLSAQNLRRNDPEMASADHFPDSPETAGIFL